MRRFFTEPCSLVMRYLAEPDSKEDQRERQVSADVFILGLVILMGVAILVYVTTTQRGAPDEDDS